VHYLIIGKTGQLAQAIGVELAQSDVSAEFLSRQDCDLSASAEIICGALAGLLLGADCVIIAAADTAVDAAETNYDTALAVNSTAPGVIATLAAKAGVPVVYISTDYVFQGDANTPYQPGDPIAPLNAYGRSKAKGEHAVLSAQANVAILRTSWVYDGASKNFLTTMLRLAETNDIIRVVNDQIGRPTYARDLARATLCAARHLIEGKPAAAGIFHVSNGGEPISWAEFATAIFKAAGTTTTVTGIPSSEYPTPAQRPAYSVLDTAKFETSFSMPLPHWRDGLARALQERTNRPASKGMS
jgi:dTDP-4-dehydrorhamnose reductase